VEDEEQLDPIDGCIEENIGWMKIASVMIDAELYDAAFTFPGGGWYAYYERPPEIIIY
jgi:hypothetical protein